MINPFLIKNRNRTLQQNIKIQRPQFTPDKNVSDEAKKLRRMIDEAQRIVAFTGAGISAESGIPTYRGAGGMWSKYDPEKFASIDYFRKDPTYYWRFFKECRHDLIAKAEPTLSHYALAELENRGKLNTIVTQNIDGLHYLAGSERVLELHGNTNRFYCLGCSKQFNLNQAWEMVQTQMPVICDDCGGIIRADVVMFGEMLPERTITEAEQETNSCDLMIVIGSSLVVYPAASLPYQAKSAGAKLAIINLDPTPLDSLADLVIRHPAANLMAQAVWLEQE